MSSKQVPPRDRVNRDVDDAVSTYLNQHAEEAALGLVHALDDPLRPPESVSRDRSTPLRAQVGPTAVFAGSDETALGVIEAARALGVRVPEELSIVGFDDTPIAQFAAPALTTVRQPLREIGAVALRTALRLADGEKGDSHHVELATELVIRHSTAPPSPADVA